MSKTKTALLDQLQDLPKPNGKVLKVRKGDNLGPTLGEIFIWQETAKYATEQLRDAWKAAAASNLVEADDVLRQGLVGEEKIVVESNDFSIIAKVDKPRQNFSREKFIELVAKKFKLDPVVLTTLAESCLTPSAAPLHKRVLEV